jgi:hypothetical protein
LPPLLAPALYFAASLGPVLLAALYAEGAHRARARADAGLAPPWIATALLVGCCAGAPALLAHLLARPPADLAAAAADPRILCFAALAGPALARLDANWRAFAAAAVSLLVVGAFAGPVALAANLAVCLAGYLVFRLVAPTHRRVAAVLQAILLLAALAALGALRLWNGPVALAVWGLFAFVGMRQMSFAASASLEPPPTLGEHLAFLFLYPTCQGAMEVFPEFRARNLAGEATVATGEALRRIVVGSLLLAIALRVDASMDRVLDAGHAFSTWVEVLRLFVRSALGVTGIWAIYEGGALLLGFRLRPNFRGILLAESPSQFWHAWRGTMTNWLVRHVYVPLGGNRRARTRNVAAAFGVSTAWHCAGTAMLHGEQLRLAHLAPVVCWGAFSFAGVALHGALRARRSVPARPALPAALVRGAKIGGTWIYGSFTVTLLDLSLGDPARFSLFLRRISGLG